MRLENMAERLEKGLVTVSKVGDAFQVISKRFDSSTGEELTPEVVAFDINSIMRDINERQAALDGLKALLAEAQRIESEG